ncbi:helix-turn-helix transcriptional regulator [Vibrio lentus]|uniref:helix-turn-helix transcriptional regulator n=1 Tax=Vibrio TaxID=662 RepID=UPI000318A1AC|nr:MULTISPECIES: AlpA family transcriptional regulator [Vibrio]OEF69577.1 DNA-binding protein [Vibrio tasmaniensis 1F-187]PMG24507.1 DNA-binding protein [Vibrio lentus]PMJ14514.1 DNA-binding protein [Vibrio lentus]PMJ79373.1 DNA-binding protein [Vibrio lentus]PMM99220.1 DNA-binding protein [Vibrio lentus]
MSNVTARLIRLNEVLVMTGLSRSGMYRSIEKQQFPSQVPIGDRAVAWVESEVQMWIAEKIEDRYIS